MKNTIELSSFFALHIITILLSLIAPARANENAPVLTITPIYSQLLAIPLPYGFKPVFESAGSVQYIHEFVLERESKNEWTQMITVTGWKGFVPNPNVTLERYALSIASGFSRACPSSFSGSRIEENKVSGHDAFIAVVSCGTSPSTDGRTSESALLVVIKGKNDYYTVQWSERGKPSNVPITINKNKWAEKLKELSPIKLCSVVLGELPPYPSCLNSKE